MVSQNINKRFIFGRIVFIEKSEGSLLSFSFRRISTSHFVVYSPLNFHAPISKASIKTKIVPPSFGQVERFFNEKHKNRSKNQSIRIRKRNLRVRMTGKTGEVDGGWDAADRCPRFCAERVPRNAGRKRGKAVVVRDAHDDPLDDVGVSEDADVHERSAPRVDALE